MHTYCNNCGNIGHLYRQCKLPVLSYGVLCFTEDLKVVMIQRKDSISYIEFLRGKYRIDRIPYIQTLLNGCSLKERELIQTLSFDELWSHLWFLDTRNLKQTERMIKEYHTSKKMFEQLQGDKLNSLLSECSTSYMTPEWEFPKGRRSSKESNLICAIREFEEETNINTNEYTLLKNVCPISEEYMGSNGVCYKHIYYIALYKGSRELSIDTCKYEQYSEISDIQWLTIAESISKIRVGYPTKLTTLGSLHNFMVHWKTDFKLKE
jgi:ADP-ribose pyrophosphatase YjhB (NUDIX family)